LKTFVLSSARSWYVRLVDRKPDKCRVFSLIYGQPILGNGSPALNSNGKHVALLQTPRLSFAKTFGQRHQVYGADRPIGLAQNERPARGDNRTGQAIWALGVDGRSRRIQPHGEGLPLPRSIGRGRGPRVQSACDFFDLSTVFAAERVASGLRFWAQARPSPEQGNSLPGQRLFGAGASRPMRFRQKAARPMAWPRRG
jgi:hypothetical protein